MNEIAGWLMWIAVLVQASRLGSALALPWVRSLSFRWGIFVAWLAKLLESLLGGSMYKDVFEPSLNDLMKEHLLARRYQSRNLRRWTAIHVSIQILFVAIDCIRLRALASITDKFAKILKLSLGG